MSFAQNASRAHFDFARLARVFFVPEHVNMEQAVELVKKPRYSNRVRQQQLDILSSLLFTYP